MPECPVSPNGIHAIPHAPQKDFEIWNKLSEKEKHDAQFCIYCGVAIW